MSYILFVFALAAVSIASSLLYKGRPPMVQAAAFFVFATAVFVAWAVA